MIEGQRRMAASTKGVHPDAIQALSFLAECLEQQGRREEAEQACGEAIQGLIALGGGEHPLLDRLKAQRGKLMVQDGGRFQAELIEFS